MKKTILALACAALAPLAFAQTSTTTETKKTTDTPVSSTTETKTKTTTTAGTVTTFEPGKQIVVRKVGVTDPITYTLGKTVQFVNKAGKTIEASMVKPGVPVEVYYDDVSGTQTVSKVVVQQD
jgi:membrane-associated protease RseP (regulator of RpoE activity)